MAGNRSRAMTYVEHWYGCLVCGLHHDFHADLAGLPAPPERPIEIKTKSGIKELLARPPEQALSTDVEPILKLPKRHRKA